MKKLGFILIFLLFLGFAGFYFFNQLGGNTPIEMILIESSPETMAGKTFIGIPQDPKLEETFKSIESLKTLNPGTKIHTIYYIEPAGKLDTMNVFVGLNLPFATGDLEGKTFSEKKYIQATITANKWVMPSPAKVKAQIEEFAKKNQVELSGIFIDKIISESEVQVIAPVKD
ncbi:hypothetical protein DFQ04_2830 [Algoriphagus boseongensis]|uniref:GyrI-like small molecule binding protein n=1 Tax=Algoriphagus boseongensis TaxID=1442587 RepID=A0A4V3D1W4_9BACT|nr:hypothetical protein [Algoriphagus boseongensis]TDQ14949.1 hypothetical protein DFQ04_2830 [Algoriphagus boseongensis]